MWMCKSYILSGGLWLSVGSCVWRKGFESNRERERVRDNKWMNKLSSLGFRELLSITKSQWKRERERKGEMDGIGGRLKVGTKENGRIAKSWILFSPSGEFLWNNSQFSVLFNSNYSSNSSSSKCPNKGKGKRLFWWTRRMSLTGKLDLEKCCKNATETKTWLTKRVKEKCF